MSKTCSGELGVSSGLGIGLGDVVTTADTPWTESLPWLWHVAGCHRSPRRPRVSCCRSRPCAPSAPGGRAPRHWSCLSVMEAVTCGMKGSFVPGMGWPGLCLPPPPAGSGLGRVSQAQRQTKAVCAQQRPRGALGSPGTRHARLPPRVGEGCRRRLGASACASLLWTRRWGPVCVCVLFAHPWVCACTLACVTSFTVHVYGQTPWLQQAGRLPQAVRTQRPSCLSLSLTFGPTHS